MTSKKKSILGQDLLEEFKDDPEKINEELTDLKQKINGINKQFSGYVERENQLRLALQHFKVQKQKYDAESHHQIEQSSKKDSRKEYFSQGGQQLGQAPMYQQLTNNQLPYMIGFPMPLGPMMGGGGMQGMMSQNGVMNNNMQGGNQINQVQGGGNVPNQPGILEKQQKVQMDNFIKQQDKALSLANEQIQQLKEENQMIYEKFRQELEQEINRMNQKQQEDMIRFAQQKEYEMQVMRENFLKREEKFLEEIKEKEIELDQFVNYRHKPLEMKIKELHEENVLHQNQGLAITNKIRSEQENTILQLKQIILKQQADIEKMKQNTGIQTVVHQTNHLPVNMINTGHNLVMSQNINHLYEEIERMKNLVQQKEKEIQGMKEKNPGSEELKEKIKKLEIQNKGLEVLALQNNQGQESAFGKKMTIFENFTNNSPIKMGSAQQENLNENKQFEVEQLKMLRQQNLQLLKEKQEMMNRIGNNEFNLNENKHLLQENNQVSSNQMNLKGQEMEQGIIKLKERIRELVQENAQLKDGIVSNMLSKSNIPENDVSKLKEIIVDYREQLNLYQDGYQMKEILQNQLFNLKSAYEKNMEDIQRKDFQILQLQQRASQYEDFLRLKDDECRNLRELIKGSLENLQSEQKRGEIEDYLQKNSEKNNFKREFAEKYDLNSQKNFQQDQFETKRKLLQAEGELEKVQFAYKQLMNDNEQLRRVINLDQAGSNQFQQQQQQLQQNQNGLQGDQVKQKYYESEKKCLILEQQVGQLIQALKEKTLEVDNFRQKQINLETSVKYNFSLLEKNAKENEFKQQISQGELQKVVGVLKEKVKESEEMRNALNKVEGIIKDKNIQNEQLAQKCQQLAIALQNSLNQIQQASALEQRCSQLTAEIEKINNAFKQKVQECEILKNNLQKLNGFAQERQIIEKEIMKMKNILELKLNENLQLKNVIQQQEQKLQIAAEIEKKYKESEHKHKLMLHELNTIGQRVHGGPL